MILPGQLIIPRKTPPKTDPCPCPTCGFTLPPMPVNRNGALVRTCPNCKTVVTQRVRWNL